MKLFIISLLTLTSLNAFADATTAQKTIELSDEYKALQLEYKDLGGSLECSEYKIVSTTDMGSSMSNLEMDAVAVVANCLADPNDGMDSIRMNLLAFVTVLTVVDENQKIWTVQSAKVVSPPQPG